MLIRTSYKKLIPIVSEKTGLNRQVVEHAIKGFYADVRNYTEKPNAAQYSLLELGSIFPVRSKIYRDIIKDELLPRVRKSPLRMYWKEVLKDVFPGRTHADAYYAARRMPLRSRKNLIEHILHPEGLNNKDEGSTDSDLSQ